MGRSLIKGNIEENIDKVLILLKLNIMMKIKKGKPLIDQHDKNGFWGKKFGGNYMPETLKKPVEDLSYFI